MIVLLFSACLDVIDQKYECLALGSDVFRRHPLSWLQLIRSLHLSHKADTEDQTVWDAPTHIFPQSTATGADFLHPAYPYKAYSASFSHNRGKPR
jgi:hypothetical protein